MRVLPSGTTAVLVELESLEQVLGTYAALSEEPPRGVVDIVPAAATILVVIDPAVTTLRAVEETVRRTTPRPGPAASGDVVEIPVTYDGEDIGAAAGMIGCEPADLVRRHTAAEWTVAFTGFAPGFGYLVSPDWHEELPRRSSPRTSVPPGSVGLAGPFSGVYPRESPGGWQLIGRTDVALFDAVREPAALLRPGVRVRFAVRDAE